MVTQLNFTLSFLEKQWVCYNDTLEVLADSLDEIDDGVEKYLRTNYDSGNFHIIMHFDFDRFPTWHRQYMPHYFNRDLTFNLT